MKKPKGFDKTSKNYRLAWYEKNFNLLVDQNKELKDELKNKKVNDISSLSYRDDVKEILNDVVNLIMDPKQNYYSSSDGDIFKRIKDMGTKVAVLYNDGVTGKGREFDAILESFALGAGGGLSSWDNEKDTSVPLAIRGLGGNSQQAIKHCWETGRDFYAIDTGYYGNFKAKIWHRVTKNNLQHLGPIIERPTDRLDRLNYKFKKFKPGRKILICPPSNKVMQLWNQPDPEEWTAQIIQELTQYTDRPIEVRLKPTRRERVSTDTIWSALDNDVHCLITYNSIAATEALIHGKPAIALGPNSAQLLCNSALEDVERLSIPTEDEMLAYVSHLSYCQFTVKELQDGTAWRIVNEGC